jgi:topoisomerase IA-like protein
MTNSEIEQICNWVQKGAKLSIGTNPNGARKVKVKHGLFGLLVERFTAEESDIQLLKQRLREAVH